MEAMRVEEKCLDRRRLVNNISSMRYKRRASHGTIDRSVADEQIIEFKKRTGEEGREGERFAIRKRFTLRTKEELHDPLKES